MKDWIWNNIIPVIPMDDSKFISVAGSAPEYNFLCIYIHRALLFQRLEPLGLHGARHMQP